MALGGRNTPELNGEREQEIASAVLVRPLVALRRCAHGLALQEHIYAAIASSF
jgi:hypothetical protein